MIMINKTLPEGLIWDVEQQGLMCVHHLPWVVAQYCETNDILSQCTVISVGALQVPIPTLLTVLTSINRVGDRLYAFLTAPSGATSESVKDTNPLI
jgi:hypothetical protein